MTTPFLVPTDMAEQSESVCQEAMLIVQELAKWDGEMLTLGPNMVKRIRTNAKDIADLSRRIEAHVRAGDNTPNPNTHKEG